MRYPPLANNWGSSNEPEDKDLRNLVTWLRLIVSRWLYVYMPPPHIFVEDSSKRRMQLTYHT